MSIINPTRGVVVALLLAGSASRVLAQQPVPDEVSRTLEQARLARDQARRALEAAERALAAAEQVLNASAGRDVIAPAAVDQPRAPPTDTAGYILCQDPATILTQVQEFTNECLGLRRWRDFNVTNLNVALAGNSSSGQIEIETAFTRLVRARSAPFRTGYRRIAPRIRAQIGEGDTTAVFGNLADFDLVSGVGIGLNLEWGMNRPSARDEEPVVRAALHEARRECMDHHLSSHAAGAPLTESQADPDVPACEGSNFRTWMSDSDRNHQYYQRVVRPLWGQAEVPWVFAGADASYARITYNYFPLVDPALTGRPLITQLPDTFPRGATEQPEDIYSVQVYGGWGFRSGDWRGLISPSITYRRDFAWAARTRDQQICAPPGSTPSPSTAFIQCFKRNIAPPYELEGFVAGLRFRSQSPRIGILPSLALELEAAYAFDVEQWRFRMPLYFLTAADGTPNGGIVFSCRTDGETSTGFPLERECTAALFVGSSFRLGTR